MQAYEFNTVIHEGMIRVPEQYQGKLLSPVRVILLSNTTEPKVGTDNKKFTAMKLQTKGFTFNREEANER
ncbi:MAG: hypothetical protein LBN98_03050 [Prevotellaceae bacterium]|jgi:hypothetical protein|nr:hypothetical protein [Prevotellaceae bacterium]